MPLGGTYETNKVGNNQLKEHCMSRYEREMGSPRRNWVLCEYPANRGIKFTP